MDGFALGKACGATASQARMVALTGYGQERDKLLSAEAGFDQHLTKPVDARRPGTGHRRRAMRCRRVHVIAAPPAAIRRLNSR